MGSSSCLYSTNNVNAGCCLFKKISCRDHKKIKLNYVEITRKKERKKENIYNAWPLRTSV